VTDTTANLYANVGSYVASRKNVTVTDAATIAQLTSIDTANGSGTLTYTSVTDTIANLYANVGSYVVSGTNVTVTDAATIAQLTSIDAANGSGTLTYTSVTDTAANITGYTGLLINKNITVTGTATVSQLHALEAMAGTGALTVAIADTTANIATALLNRTDSAYLGSGYTLTDSATVTTVNGAPTSFSAYTGPVAGITKQYIATSNGLNTISGDNNGDFIKGGTGTDAIAGGAGTDIIDGGTGSNFLSGGNGWDRFFVDLRGSGTTWSTITDYYINNTNSGVANEQVSIFTPESFDVSKAKLTWVDNAGAAGYTGATLNISLNGNSNIDASVTFSSKSSTDMSKMVTEFTASQINQSYGLIWIK
jgi:hypothetical protein